MLSSNLLSIQLPQTLIVAFIIVIIFMLILDLGVFNKNSHAISNHEAAIWSVVWVAISMAFSIFIYVLTNEASGLEKFSQFQSAYWIEKALSVDNLFVFILVFKFFNVPNEYQHKVLFWGILGALVMRAIFIFSGVGIINLTYLDEIFYGNVGSISYILINAVAAILLFTGIYILVKKQFSSAALLIVAGVFSILLFNMSFLFPSVKLITVPHINIVLTLFGLFLIYAGVKSWFISDDEDEKKDFSQSPGAKFIHKIFKVSKEFDQDRFFTVENGVKLATPLLVVVGVIEFTDLLFAVDSIPAIFAIAPNDPFILYTSNIFAILGLRSLYFLLANFIHMFSKLKYGLAVVLTFIGIKMVIDPFFHITSTVSLSIVGGVLILSVIASVVVQDKEDS